MMKFAYFFLQVLPANSVISHVSFFRYATDSNNLKEAGN